MIPRPADRPICFAEPRRLALSAWMEHVPFGMYLVDLLRPSSIVELGTRNGVSYCAFCQAVQQLQLDTSCVAVDSWHGDAHTGAYGPGVLAELHRHHDPLYGGFSRLQQSSFDEAALGTAEASVDLLHIDGLHTYAAVRHDFETWLPKLSSHGVVLFHDIAEHSRDFGVWRLWADLSQSYPSFAFRHGHGLGVLGVGQEIPEEVRGLFELAGVQAQDIHRFFRVQGLRAGLQSLVHLATRLPDRFVGAVVEFVRRQSLKLEPGD